MNKLLKTKNILNMIIGVFVIITSLIMFIKSYEIYKDDAGTDISFNSDYVISMLIGIIIFVHGVLSMKEANKVTSIICGVTASFLIGLYPLGIFFKALSKALSKGATFDFIGNQTYLYTGILGLIMLGYYIVSYYYYKKR